MTVELNKKYVVCPRPGRDGWPCRAQLWRVDDTEWSLVREANGQTPLKAAQALFMEDEPPEVTWESAT